MTTPIDQRYTLIGGALIPIGVMASGIRVMPHVMVENFRGMRMHTQTAYAAEEKK